MKKLFTPEIEKFIHENAKGLFNSDLATLVNDKFGTNYTAEQMRQYKSNHKIKGETGTSKGKRGSDIFTNEEEEFIRENFIGICNKELTDMLNSKFGTSYNTMQIKNYKRRNKLDSGLNGQFNKCHTPYNKGVKGKCGKGCEKTWFKKGNIPKNHKPVGSERIDSKDGYTLVKTAEPRTWRLKHVVLWEAHNGPVPKGYKVIFLDGDITNITIENLAIMSNKEMLMANRLGLRYKNKELTEVGINIAKLAVASKNRKKNK